MTGMYWEKNTWFWGKKKEKKKLCELVEHYLWRVTEQNPLFKCIFVYIPVNNEKYIKNNQIQRYNGVIGGYMGSKGRTNWVRLDSIYGFIAYIWSSPVTINKKPHQGFRRTVKSIYYDRLPLPHFWFHTFCTCVIGGGFSNTKDKTRKQNLILLLSMVYVCLSLEVVVHVTFDNYFSPSIRSAAAPHRSPNCFYPSFSHRIIYSVTCIVYSM